MDFQETGLRNMFLIKNPLNRLQDLDMFKTLRDSQTGIWGMGGSMDKKSMRREKRTLPKIPGDLGRGNMVILMCPHLYRRGGGWGMGTVEYALRTRVRLEALLVSHWHHHHSRL